MTINVSAALDSNTAGIVTVERQAPGSYVDGIYVPGAITTFKTICSVQQPNDKQLQSLSEGDRSNDPRLFIAKKELRTTRDKDNQQADIVLYKGNRYRIISDGDWTDYGYSSAIGVRD